MRASGYERAEDDWYVEPAWVVHQLLALERFPGVVWDPAAGGGTIPRAIAERGGHATGTDIHPRYPECGTMDFFTASRRIHDNPDHIVSNPPYKDLEGWVRHALSLVDGKVAVIARLAFLEGQARRAFFREAPLARVRVCSRRPSMPPGALQAAGEGVLAAPKASGGSIAYAWFIFDHSVTPGATQISWLG